MLADTLLGIKLKQRKKPQFKKKLLKRKKLRQKI